MTVALIDDRLICRIVEVLLPIAECHHIACLAPGPDSESARSEREQRDHKDNDKNGDGDPDTYEDVLNDMQLVHSFSPSSKRLNR
jgi:hypothetical protein